MESDHGSPHESNVFASLENILLDSSYENAMSRSFSAADAHPLSPLSAEDSFKGGIHRIPFPRSSHSNKTTRDTFPEPPFAQVMPLHPGHRIVHDGQSEYHAATPAFSPSSSLSQYIQIEVSQPQKAQDTGGSSIVPGNNTYVTYLILTKTNIPQYGGREFAVRRRFRDVVSLADRLSDSYRGYFIPVRPDKSLVESQVMHKQDFIEQRRAAIEKYLQRLANHPIIRTSDEFKSFLQSQGKLPLIPITDIVTRMLDGAVSIPRQKFGERNEVMSPQNIGQPVKGGRDLLRMFKELKQSVTNEWAGVKPSIKEEDKEFLEKKNKIELLERRLSDASKQAEALIKKQKELSEVTGEVGLTFIKLSKFEIEEAILNTQRTHATDAKRVATAAVKASRLHREANDQSMKYLDQLHEYLSLMQSIHVAFNDRSTALLTVQTLITEISSINARIDKLNIASSKIFGGDNTRSGKIEELKESLAITEASFDSATREYDHIKEINKRELAYFDAERQSDFMEMIKGFVNAQVGYAEKIANVWSKVVEECNTAGTFLSFPVSTTEALKINH